MRWIILISLLACTVYGISYYMEDAVAEAPKAPPAPSVAIAPATRSNVTQTIEVVGNVIAYETVAIKSRLDSQIVDVLFQDGQNVTQGQVLFKLDDRSLQAQIKQLEADVKKARAQLENARLQYSRAQKLIGTKAVSQSFLDDAKATYEAQSATVSATQASLDNTRVLLSYTSITAPISGRAGTINVTRGNNVKANDTQPLVTINRVQPIRVQFSLAERYYSAIKQQMAGGALKVDAVRDNGALKVTGELEYIDNAIDTSTGTFAARAIFSNSDESLWPGMFVNVRVALGDDKNVLTIPAVALQGDQDKHFVFVYDDASKKAVKTDVTLTRIEGTTAIVRTGLKDGQYVITDGLLRVSDGAVVAATPESAATP
jgi:multidrug efflux system membrane fusion protein